MFIRNEMMHKKVSNLFWLFWKKEKEKKKYFIVYLLLLIYSTPSFSIYRSFPYLKIMN